MPQSCNHPQKNHKLKLTLKKKPTDASIERPNDKIPNSDSPFRSIKKRGFYPSMLDRLSRIIRGVNCQKFIQ